VKVKFNSLLMYLCACDEKSKLLTRAIRPVLSDQVTYILQVGEYDNTLINYQQKVTRIVYTFSSFNFLKPLSCLPLAPATHQSLPDTVKTEF